MQADTDTLGQVYTCTPTLAQFLSGDSLPADPEQLTLNANDAYGQGSKCLTPPSNALEMAAWAAKQAGLSTRQAVFMIMAAALPWDPKGAEYGVCYAKQNTLAKLLGITRTSIVKALTALEKEGKIVREKRRWDDSGKQRTNRYRIPKLSTLPDSPSTHLSTDRVHSPSTHLSTDRVLNEPNKKEPNNKRTPLPPVTKKIEPKAEPSHGGGDNGKKDFWERFENLLQARGVLYTQSAIAAIEKDKELATRIGWAVKENPDAGGGTIKNWCSGKTEIPGRKKKLTYRSGTFCPHGMSQNEAYLYCDECRADRSKRGKYGTMLYGESQ